ncbi:DUF167 domain-containing protein [Patescibacteria group bacterium]|nr:DUF167 domain-containing protein [Patescibacteria group bacterium]
MRLKIKIIPNSSKTLITEEKGDYLKIKIKAIPEKGKANIELINFLAKYFKIAKSNIKIIKGTTSRNKIIEI